MYNASFVQYVHKRVFVNFDNCSSFVDTSRASFTPVLMAEAMELRKCVLFELFMFALVVVSDECKLINAMIIDNITCPHMVFSMV